MPLESLKNILAQASLAKADQFSSWIKAWRIAHDGGSEESLFEFLSRETGLSENDFLKKLAAALNWPLLDLPALEIPPEARERISTKVAFQYMVMAPCRSPSASRLTPP
jgi:hypothetical protein